MTLAAKEIHPLEQALVGAQSESIEANLARWHRFAGEPAWLELQALHVRGERSSFEASRFAHADETKGAARLAAVADKWTCPAVYVIANPIMSAVASRAVAGQWHDAKKGESTSDAEIAARAVLTIDIDARRPKGTSATTAEMLHTSEAAIAIHDELAGLLEDASPLAFAHTGNGRMNFLALDMLDVVEAGRRHQAMLIALAARFTNAHVEIDRSVHDAKRLVPCWGTLKKKGAENIADRPHRRTAFTCGERVRRITLAELDGVIASLRDGLSDDVQRDIDRALGRTPAKAAHAPTRQTSGDDVFARAKEVPIRDVLGALGLLVDDVPVCCGCGLSDGGVAIVGNGLKCSHARCASKGVRDGFRTPIDVVIEAKGVTAIEAVRFLGERFGFDVATRRHPTQSFDEPAPPLDQEPASLDAENAARLDEQDAAEQAPAPKREPLTPARVLEAMKHRPVVHVATGIAALDERTKGGPRFCDLVALLGAPDAGKTTIATAIADYCATNGMIVGFCAYDDDEEDLATRLAQRRNWTRAEVEERTQFEDLLARMPTLFIFDATWPIESVIEDLASRAGDKPVVLIVDSLQTMNVTAAANASGKLEAISAGLRTLRIAAKARRWLVIVTSEMVRSSYSNVGDRIASLAAAKWSGDVEYSAKLLLAVRSVKDQPDLLELEIAKSKLGAKGEFYLKLDRAHQRLEPAATPDKAEEAQEKKAARAARDEKERDAAAAKLARIVAKEQGIGRVKLLAKAKNAGLGGKDTVNALLVYAQDAGLIEDRTTTHGTRVDHAFYTTGAAS